MCNQWLGYDFPLERLEFFSPDLYINYRLFKYMAPYKDPLWAIITLNDDGSIEIRGKKSSWLGPSPTEMGFDFWNAAYPSVPYISDRKIPAL